MIDIQTQFSEQLQQFSDFQKQAVDALQGKGAVAVDSYEKAARHNLAVLTDVVDYSVEQAKLASSAQNPEEYFASQINSASAFAKVVEGRTKDFIDLLMDAATSVTDDIQQAQKKVVEAATKKAA